MSKPTKTTEPRPWNQHGSARDITGNWPKAAERTRDNPDEIIRVCSRERFAAAYAETKDPARALAMSETCILYVRHTSSTVHVVALVGGWNEARTIRYGSASGYGYDRATAAAAGIPVAPGVVLTDWCGRDREPEDRPFPELRQFIATRGNYLPPDLFLV